MDTFVLPNGQVIHNVHPVSACAGRPCCIHNPSDHSMKDFPQSWRDDRGLMERICPHGIGHPDPDQIDFIRSTRGEKAASNESIHGCDGCCGKREQIQGYTA